MIMSVLLRSIMKKVVHKTAIEDELNKVLFASELGKAEVAYFVKMSFLFMDS